MLKSMTGFGRGSYEDADFSVNIEMKTVNHRYNEVAIRLPRFLNPLEDKIRKTILKTVSRGRIDVFITADYNVSGNCTLKVDKNLAAAYHKALQEVGVAIGADAAGINAAAEILYLSKCPDVINVKEGFFDVESVWPKVEQAVEQAVKNAEYEIPQPMIDTQTTQMVEDFAQRIQSQGITLEQYFQFTGLTAEKMMEDMKPQAIKRIETRLVLEAIAKAENIEITDEKVDEELAKMAESYKMEVEKLKEFMGENEKKQMKEDLAVQEAVTFLVENAVEK